MAVFLQGCTGEVPRAVCSKRFFRPSNIGNDLLDPLAETPSFRGRFSEYEMRLSRVFRPFIWLKGAIRPPASSNGPRSEDFRFLDLSSLVSYAMDLGYALRWNGGDCRPALCRRARSSWIIICGNGSLSQSVTANVRASTECEMICFILTSIS